jgi:Ribose/xylose/arabinose/galactoside ABC-type transport systems, permease components
LGSLGGGEAVQRLLAFGALVLLIILFSFWSPFFFNFDNLNNILIATSVVGVLALGETFVIVTGGIDLSIGTVMTMSSVMCATAVARWGLPVPVGILIGVATGGVMGFLNGVLIAQLKLPPFIATLGTLNVARGLSLVIAGLSPVYFPTDELHGMIMGSTVGAILPAFPVPNIAIIMLGAAALAGFILSMTSLGRYAYALGSNEEAARLSGISVVKWKIAVYSLGGLFAGLGGVLLAARVSSAQPTLGYGYELDAISAVVIGGTSLVGGVGTILGTVIGAFIVKTLADGLQLVNVPQEWQIVATGVVVILAVYLDIVRRRGRQS